MPKYAVPFKTGAFTTVYVEADSPEEAAAEVFERDITLPYVCAQCAGWGQHGNSGLEIGDWDVDDSEMPWEVSE